MQMIVAGLTALAAAGAHGAELLNSDFETLKSRLVGTWSFTENGQSTKQHLKRSLTVMLFWNAIRALSRFIILTAFIPCS